MYMCLWVIYIDTHLNVYKYMDIEKEKNKELGKRICRKYIESKGIGEGKMLLLI